MRHAVLSFLLLGCSSTPDSGTDAATDAPTTMDDAAMDKLLDRQSKVLVVPFSAGYWEIDVDDNVTATSYLTYQALVGENCDHQLVPNASGFVNANLAANPMLNIASHNPATTTLSMRIVGISQNLSNQDYTGLFTKMIVAVNKGAEPFYTNVGT